MWDALLKSSSEEQNLEDQEFLNKKGFKITNNLALLFKSFSRSNQELQQSEGIYSKNSKILKADSARIFNKEMSINKKKGI